MAGARGAGDPARPAGGGRGGCRHARPRMGPARDGVRRPGWRPRCRRSTTCAERSARCSRRTARHGCCGWSTSIPTTPLGKPRRSALRPAATSDRGHRPAPPTRAAAGSPRRRAGRHAAPGSRPPHTPSRSPDCSAWSRQPLRISQRPQISTAVANIAGSNHHVGSCAGAQRLGLTLVPDRGNGTTTLLMRSIMNKGCHSVGAVGDQRFDVRVSVSTGGGRVCDTRRAARATRTALDDAAADAGAAVDHVGLAGDPAGGVAGQERDQVGDVGGLAEALRSAVAWPAPRRSSRRARRRSRSAPALGRRRRPASARARWRAGG